MGNKVNPNLLRLTQKSLNSKSFWNINKNNQYKTFIYQDFIIRKYITFIFESFLQVPVGNIEIQRDSNNNLKIIIPFCSVTSYVLRRNFSQKKIFKIINNQESKINLTNNEEEKIRIKQNYINLIKELLEFKIKSFSKSASVEIVLKNYYNKIIRYFFSSFWKQNRQLENRFQKYPFYKNFNIFLSFALQQKSPEVLANFCANQLQNVPNGRHHLILNILQFSLPVYSALVPNILGLKIQVSGNLQGSERKRKRIIQMGQIPLQTISANVKYSFKPALTKFGSIGVKVWMYAKEDFISNNHLYSNINKCNNSNLSITDILNVISKIK